MRILRLGVDDLDEVRRYLGWDTPRCSCFQPLPEVGLFCGAEKCREQLATLRRQVAEIDLDSDEEDAQ